MNSNPASPSRSVATSRKRSPSLSGTNSRGSSSLKRHRTEEQRNLDDWASFEYPPEYWDRLSRIVFTPLSLRELDRRAQLALRESSPPPPSNAESIERFARAGGPDLFNVIGCARPVSSSIVRDSTEPPTDEPPSSRASDELVTSYKMQNLTPYDRNFGQHLTDHDVYGWTDAEPLDVDELLDALVAPHASISLSDISATDFKAFCQNDALAESEADAVYHIVPVILGPITDECARNVLFGNLEELTDGTIAADKPDVYYGAIPKELNRAVSDELETHIIPSTTRSRPIIPNFILEVKGVDGASSVLERQVRYGGALSCRAMHSLQNYSKDQPEYDGKPYTFTATYLSGQLRIFAHHITAPTVDGGRPRYHMTPVSSWLLTSNRRQFVEGVTAFRNARDLAKSYRDRFIADANAVVAARGSGDVPNGTATSTEEHEDDDDVSIGGIAHSAD